MMLGYVAFCLAAGILWADQGRGGVFSSLPDGVTAWIAVTLVALAIVGTARRWSSIRAASRIAIARDPDPAGHTRPLTPSVRSDHRAEAAFSLRVLGTLLAGVIAFDAGAIVLGEPLREAQRDRERALEASQQDVRMAQARVVARRARSWGDDVDLSDVRATDGGTPLPARLVLRVPADPKKESTRESRADGALWTGSHVRLAVRILPIHAQRNPGSIDREREWARRGIAARARLVDPNWIVLQSDPGSFSLRVARWLARWRAELRRVIGARLERSGDSTGLARALSLGDREALAPEIGDAFRALGLSHLLAISGLHVGMVAGLLGWLSLRALAWGVPRLIDPFPWVFGIAALGAGGYAWLVGGSISVKRAWCCLLVVGLFAAARRSPRPIELLSGIAIVLWIREPSMLFDLGAQLSFAACLGLVAAGVWRGPLAGRPEQSAASVDAKSIAERMRRNLVLSLRASCAAGFGTAGILASHGLSTAGVAPLANALAVPWTALVVLPASLGSAFLSLLSLTGFGPDSIPGPGMTLFLTCLLWPARALVDSATWCAARLPRSLFVESGSPFLVGVLVGATVLLGLAALRAGWFRLALSCWILLAASGGVPRADHRLVAELPRVWFFDVGQGDAALVEGRSGSILIDTGPGAPDGSGGQALVRSLRALGRTAIDLLVVTHADLDHRGGAIRVLESLSVAELWLPAAGRGDPVLDRLVQVARARDTRVSWRRAEEMPEYRGDVRIETLWPPGDRVPRSRNAGSLVLRVGLGGQSILFLADVDAAIELELSREAPGRVRADFLKVSHHGSRGGTSRPFLGFVAARHAFVSAPCRNGRGLPNSETLDRIRRSGTRLWWTGRDGALAVFPERFESADEVVPWARPRACPD